MVNYNNELWELLGMFFAVLLLLLILGSFVAYVWLPFKEDRDNIKMEMHRSEGGEYRYWKRKLRLLYLRHIPIVGWFFRKKY